MSAITIAQGTNIYANQLQNVPGQIRDKKLKYSSMIMFHDASENVIR